MAACNWTSEQRQVIECRDKNLLVSAAAGSGKTAVLVERIIRMISEGENPVDIDKLVIMTFTKAAAGEMKERISAALDKLILEANEKGEDAVPNIGHIRRQQRLIHNAQISTIHSFCLNIIRDYYYLIDLDPSFRIGDETELKLLMADVLLQLIEDKYAEGDEAFINFVDAYGGTKKDNKIEEYIYSVSNFSLASPEPDRWLEKCKEDLEKSVTGAWTECEYNEAGGWIRGLLDLCKYGIEGAIELAEEAECICKRPYGPEHYLKTIIDDQNNMRSLCSIKNYSDLRNKLLNFEFGRLSGKKKKDAVVDEELQEQVKHIRETYKKDIDSIINSYFSRSIPDLLEDMELIAKPGSCLIDLVREFNSRFAKVKRDKNIIDYNDIEHLAYEILEKGAAEELRSQYHEIMIDEYQDSNLIQEAIAYLLAGKDYESLPKRFMVGDIKQSIYAFRMARPDLFAMKKLKYSMGEEGGHCINLHKNFRSRQQVIDSVNEVFRRYMQLEVGNVLYDENEYLYQGAEYKEGDSDYRTEFIYLDMNSGEMGKDDESEASLEENDAPLEEIIDDVKTAQATVVAQRIEELIESKFQVQDKSGELRTVNYGDIAILLRSMSGWAEALVDVLQNKGIPVYSDVKNGFYNTIEVKVMLEYMRLLDNPEQDIPLAACLHSPIAGLSSDELALIKIAGEAKQSFYQTVRAYLANNKETDIGKKLAGFFEEFDYLRAEYKKWPMETLVSEIYRRTGFYEYVSALPHGERRQANLEMLLTQAVTYENSSYSGLFSFIRYIEKIKQQKIDQGEASSYEGGNAVRIMTIHSSKGLEFPVVILPGIDKQFNDTDEKSNVICHFEYGLGMNCIDIERRIKHGGLIHNVIQKMMRRDLIGEELRVLYVALTRAREKLILLGRIKDEKKYSEAKEKASVSSILKIKSYLDILYPVVLADNKNFTLRYMNAGSIAKEEKNEYEKKQEAKRLFYEAKQDISDTQLLEYMNYEYPYSGLSELPIKLSVSELKKKSMEEEFGEDVFHHVKNEEGEFIPRTPDFIGGEKQFSGTDRGTLYHKIMQFLDYSLKSYEQVEGFLENLVKMGIITLDDKKKIDVRKIAEFNNTELAEELLEADRRGMVFREQPFVMGISADMVSDEYEGRKEYIPVQGIIDLYYEKDGEYILIDYKTDRVSYEDGEDRLIKLYKRQLEIYADAIERLSGKKVREAYLYSFTLSKFISVR